MKRAIYIISGILFTLLLFLIVSHIFPKSVGRFPFFVVLFLLDLYLFQSIFQRIKHLSRFMSALAFMIYWLPALLTGLLTISLLLYPFDQWGKWIKIYVVGFIFAAYFAKLIPICILIIDDSRRLIQRFLVRKVPKPDNTSEAIPRSVFLRRLGLLSSGVLFSSLLVGMTKWVTDFRLKKVKIPVRGLPPAFSGLRIVQFSDIHLGTWASVKELDDAVTIINDLNPDVIFFTGDLVNYKTDEAFEFTGSLARLKAPMGILAILGNHDYGDYSNWNHPQDKKSNMEQLYDFYRNLGWKLLLNENFILQRENDSVAILGVENWGSFGRFQKYGNLETALSGVEKIPVKILLSHDPSHWQYKVLESPVDITLTLSGHTHGAQFGFEFPGFRWSPSQYIYKYWAGLYAEANRKTNNVQYLYVNRGIGTIGYPGRVGILPEITLIELV
jgi:predicted MPP superfamily phosphohydrolase